MKRITLIFATTLALFTASARADSIGAFYGIMDTKHLGEGQMFGGMLRIDPLPLLSIEARGAYVYDFDTLTDIEKKLSKIGIKGDIEFEDFCVVPIEVGLIGRFSLFGFLGIYGGGGVGYYVIPAFDIVSTGGFSVSEDIDNITGWWAVAGVEAGLPNLCLFAEVKYTHIQDDVKMNFEFGGYDFNVDADIDLSGVSALIGVRLKW